MEESYLFPAIAIRGVNKIHCKYQQDLGNNSPVKKADGCDHENFWGTEEKSRIVKQKASFFPNQLWNIWTV